MVLVLECIQNFIKLYWVHCCTHAPFALTYISYPLPTPTRNKILHETLYMTMTKYEFTSSGQANEVSYFQVTC